MPSNRQAALTFLGFRHFKWPRPVVIVGLADKALRGCVHVQSMARVFPTDEEMTFGGHQAQRIAKSATDGDVEHRHGRAGSLVRRAGEAMNEDVLGIGE